MRERVLPWLLALPALWFAPPFSPLAGNFYPHLEGGGLALLALLPLALALVALGARGSGAWPFVALAAWAALTLVLSAPTDPVEARRALCFLALAPLAFAGGATLERAGRRHFAWLRVLASCAWTVQALLAGLISGDFGSVLGDSGSLSQAALPGAAVGAGWIALTRGRQRIVGACALVLFLLHVAAAPVLAGGHTLLAALLLAVWRGVARARPRLLVLSAVALLTPFVGMALGQMATGEITPLEGATRGSAHTLSGLGVRGLVWKASLGMLADHPLVGVGAGQFQEAFPPYRDPVEIELSRHGVCSEVDTEVEHAHNDWLQAWLELGIPGGALLALGLVLGARAALATLGDEERAPLAMAALALLVNAFVHAPLDSNPASAPLAFALLGCVAARGTPGRGAALVCALPALLALPLARSLVRDGARVGECSRAQRRLSELLERAADGSRDAALAEESERLRALVLPEPGSRAAPLLFLAARIAPPPARPALWDAALAVRPHSAEAWEQSAVEAARAGRTAEARRRFGEALALSPTHPRILRNAARLECTQGDLAAGLEHVQALRANGCLDPEWLRSLGEELVLELGLAARGARVLRGVALEQLSPEELHAESREDPASADVLECLAQLLWGREHAARGEWEVAVRSYRQSWERSRRREPAGAPALALELAAAEMLAGRAESAAEHARAVPLTPLTWAALPDWALASLARLGLEAPDGN